jgi:hypothetical protein
VKRFDSADVCYIVDFILLGYRCAIARCRLRLSAFPVSSWLLVGVEEFWMLCGSYLGMLRAWMELGGLLNRCWGFVVSL